jgi:hypothetical protein
LFKDKVEIKKSLIPGNLLFYFYDAKDKEQTYDKTPLVLVLRRSKGYTLGLNFHWLPMPLRILLVKKILSMNKKNIKNNKPLDFNYKDLKPFLKKLGYAPCIRLYITSRISSKGVLIPSSSLMEATKIKSETFTKGKYSAEQLYKKALKGNKKYRSSRKRRQ